MTCTSGYILHLKIDSKKVSKIDAEYIGPKKRDYEKELSFNLSNDKKSYFKIITANTVCRSKDFKNSGYHFLKLKNIGSEEVYICVAISGEEVPDIFKQFNEKYRTLFDLYGKQDDNPNYDYTKDETFKNINYIDRYELYDRLLKEKYPYIIKLPPGKTCIMKWGGYGFNVID